MFAAENGLRGDPRLQAISEAIRVVPNFPKPGTYFLVFFLFCVLPTCKFGGQDSILFTFYLFEKIFVCMFLNL